MESCMTCKNRLFLSVSDYSQKGCVHSEGEGYICLAFQDEGIAEQMIGVDPESTMCEMFVSQ